MVGIPRSGGCTTCRKRKIKCDRSQPDCGTCLKAGRRCEGYKTFPVFVNRTAEGLQRRQPFEEVRPSPSENARVSKDNFMLHVASKSSHTIPNRFVIYSNAKKDLSADHVDLGMIQQNAFLARLCQHHLPQRPDALDGHWLWLASRLSNPAPAVQAALKSVSFAHAAIMQNDRALMFRAKEAYGETIQHLYEALSTPRSGSADETMLLIRIVTFFELLDSKSEKQPWIQHQAALENLIFVNGPGIRRSAIGKALYRQARRAAFYRSLVRSRHTFFELPEWRKAGREAVDCIDDLAFLILNIYIEITEAVTADLAPSRATRFVRYSFSRCTEALDSLGRWIGDYLADQPSPPYWPENASMKSHDQAPSSAATEADEPLVFASYSSADSILHFWTIMMVLALAVKTLQRRYGSLTQAPEFDAIFARIKAIARSSTVLGVASLMVQSISFFLQGDMGRYSLIRAACTIGVVGRAVMLFDFSLNPRHQDYIVDVQRAMARENLLAVPLNATSDLLDPSHSRQIREIYANSRCS